MPHNRSISMDLVTVDISNLPKTPKYLCVFSPEYQVDDFAKTVEPLVMKC